MKKFTLFLVLLITSSASINAQIRKTRCSTDQQMEKVFQKDPSARVRYEAYRKDLEERVRQVQLQRTERPKRTEAIITIPVVVHVLINNPNMVTAATVQRQIDTLNWYYGSQPSNDSLRVYAPFRTTFGRTQIRFCLAQRDPNDLPTTGITRKATTTRFNDNNSDQITVGSQGGIDAWDTRRYLNMWIVEFSDETLGYSYLPGTFPTGDGRIGFVADYRAFGSGASYLHPDFNGGKTAVHEIGHYFNLLHPWGNTDNSNCTLSDGVSDTPPTEGPTFGCPANPVLDDCAPTAPGKMAQNHMDYEDDACMVLFTKEQALRMETALNSAEDRKTLLTSNGCSPILLLNRDLKPIQFIEPPSSICEANNVRPIIQVYNNGTDTIRSFNVNYSINGGAIATTAFTGAFGFNQTANVTLASSNFTLGNNIIKLYTSQPNGQGDQNPLNDTIIYTFRVITARENSLVEGFENAFPPADWDITQAPADAITWKKTTAAGKNSTSSAFINNFNYAALNRIDNLVTAPVRYSGADSVYLKFDVSAITYSYPGSTAVPLDTLEVLASTDCGRTFQTIYKKYGYQLQTVGDPNYGYTDEFFPKFNSQWRTDSINLTTFLGTANTVRFAFRNTTNFDNNIFVDNVNVYTKVLPERLKSNGILISPNPFRDRFVIQHYLPPTDLRAYVIYNSVGQQVLTRSFSQGMAQSYMEVNMSNYPSGVYTVRLIYTARNTSLKVVKVN